MNQDLIGLAFAAGMVAALNPCGFAMLPAYLTLVIEREDGRPGVAVLRALAATAAMTAGFLAVFASFGLLSVSVAAALQRYLPYVTVLVGLVLIVLGGWILAGRELSVRPLGGGVRRAPTARLGSMFGYGVGYAVASLSCTVGPFLAVTGSSLRGGSPLAGLGVYLAYAAGLGLVVGVLAVGVAVASTAVLDRMRRVLPHVNRLSGLILVVVGLYVAYYGVFEIRLMGSGQVAGDPVIAAAGRVQRTLAGWVYQHGAWPWVWALAAGAGLAAAVAGVLRHRRRVRVDAPG